MYLIVLKRAPSELDARNQLADVLHHQVTLVHVALAGQAIALSRSFYHLDIRDVKRVRGP